MNAKIHKRTFVLFSFVFTMLSVELVAFGHTLELVSGESIEGEFIGGDQSTVTLKTAKGKRVIPIRTISKIVFHESNKTSPAGTLEGVVTYYFNKNYGDKPDVGSEVFALHTSKIGVKNLTC